VTCDERPAWQHAPSAEHAYLTPQLRALLGASRPSNDVADAEYAPLESGMVESAARDEEQSGEHRITPELHQQLVATRSNDVDPEPAGDAPEQHGVFGPVRSSSPASATPSVRPNAAARWPGFEAGPYRLTRRLGAGRLGAVWIAQQQNDSGPERVAIRFAHAAAPSGDAIDPALRLRAARPLMAALVHPNIARIYDATLDSEGLPYVVLQYIPGRPLLEYCRSAEPSIAQRVRLALQAAQALGHAHAHNLVHGNLKPNNLLVTPQGTLRQLDLGSELLLGPAAGHARTSPYAAPEQLCGAPADFACDVYALGALFYEALSGARPYSVPPGSSRALREAALTQLPAAPSSRLGAELPAALDALVLRTLSKLPEDRPSARGLALELKALLSGPLSERRHQRRGA
jgi:serine/threonine-protein kinase